MRRNIVQKAIIALILITVPWLFTGCGKAKKAVQTARKVGQQASKAAGEMKKEGKTHIKTDEGEVTIDTGDEKEGTKVTLKDKEGKTTTAEFGGTDIDISDLDMPVYPGAKKQDVASVSGPNEKGIRAELTTTDSFEKVASFYKDKFPDAKTAERSSGNEKRLVISVAEDQEGKTRGVELTKQKDEKQVDIRLIDHVKKAE